MIVSSMFTQIEIINELRDFFEPTKIKINVVHPLPYTQWHDKQEIDLVLDERIAVEVKSDFTMKSILQGIGQAILNLRFYGESWLAVPFRAVEITSPILETVKIESLKVLDWENMELYEVKEEKVISRKL